MTRFEGMCVGGPCHGSFHAAHAPYFQVYVNDNPAIMSPDKWADMAQKITVVTYHWTKDDQGYFWQIEKGSKR